MTKTRQRLKHRYETLLKRSGHRSYVAANERRFQLIQTQKNSAELELLQEVVLAYCRYRDNDLIRRSIRQLKREMERMAI